MNTIQKGLWSALLVPTVLLSSACSMTDGPQGGMGGAIDKSGDTRLQTMIDEVQSTFVQLEYQDADTGLSVPYNLYIPDGYDGSQSFPMMVFIADSSVVGRETTAPLTQGYGGLIWATEEEQRKHPSFVLVPEFPEVIIDDHGEFTMTDYVEVAARLVRSVAAEYNVDRNRLYATGQSMGCMTLLYLSAQYPDLFAAEMFVSGQWDVGTLDGLGGQSFFYIVAEGDPKASEGQRELYEALTAQGAAISTAVWDATWPEDRMAQAVESLVSEGNSIHFVAFEKGSVLPEGTAASDRGGEHMYSFDPAYKIEGVRDWVYNQSSD